MSSTFISNMTVLHTQIKVLQLNCNKKLTATYSLLNEQLNKVDILLL